MDNNTVNELVEKVLQGNTDAMLGMAKYLLSGGEHPYLDARQLLTFASEAGNKEATILLKLIDWEKRKSQFDNAVSPKHEETPALSGGDNIIEETANVPEGDNDEAMDDENNDEEAEEKDGETDKLLRVKLLQAKANYRSWRDSYAEQPDPQEREEAMRLYTEAVKEYENGNRNKPMDKDLMEGLVLLAQYHDEVGHKEEALRFMKLGADNGQETLAYTYGMHLKNADREEEAEEYFKKALDGPFTKVRARLALAMLYLQTPGFFQKNKTEAWTYINEGIDLLEEQTTISSECYILYLLKGDYWRRIGKSKEARAAYEAALKKLQEGENSPRELRVITASSLAELYAKAGKAKLANKYSMLAKKMEAEL